MNIFLSCTLFKIMGRLCYNVYLFHFLFQSAMQYSKKGPSYFSHFLSVSLIRDPRKNFNIFHFHRHLNPLATWQLCWYFPFLPLYASSIHLVGCVVWFSGHPPKARPLNDYLNISIFYLSRRQQESESSENKHLGKAGGVCKVFISYRKLHSNIV